MGVAIVVLGILVLRSFVLGVGTATIVLKIIVLSLAVAVTVFTFGPEQDVISAEVPTAVVSIISSQ